MTTNENMFDKLANGSKWNAGVTFERTNPVPLEKYSVFSSMVDAVAYAGSNPVAHPGQVIAVNENEIASFTASLSVDPEITATITLPSYDLKFIDDGTGWNIEFSNGYTYSGYFQVYDPEQEEWLTSGTNTSSDLSIRFETAAGNLKIPIDDTIVLSALVTFTRESTTINTWNLYVLDQSAPNGLKKIEGGSSSGGGSSGDVQAEEARAKAAELELSNALTAKTSYLSTTVDALSGKLTSDYQQISGMSAYQQVSGMSAYVKKDDLSNANAGGLSNATAANPIMLSSDLSALVTKAIVLKGTVSTSAELSDKTDAKVGDMWIAADTGAEYVYANPNGETLADKWQELGREGTIAEIARYIAELSGDNGQIAYLSNAITANAQNISTLSNTTIPTLCTDLSNAVKSVSGDLTFVSSDIYTPGTGLSAQVTSVSSTVLTVQNDVASLRTDVNGISTDIYNEGGISSQILTLSGAVNSLVNDQVSITIDDLSSTELNVKHISEADYHQLVVDGKIDPKTIYIVSADGYQNMYGERITNLSTLSTDISSAANVSFVTAYVGDQMATVSGDVKYLSNAITAITANIDYLSGQIDSLSGAMVSAVVISAETRAISANVRNGIATISGLSVSDLAWDISVINGGDSGYVPQTEEPVES